ncbi:alpha-mannosidase 2-like [Babylonia areolata]|uniref:alpha-mannosidase 2-like n=1 Tax=Babylonia areolata TaxID=304850 RepID=UPI003FD21970
MARLKATHMLLMFVALYLATCYYVYIAVDTQLTRSEEYQKWKRNAGPDEWPVLDIRKNKNGSWQFLRDECPVHTVIKHSHLSARFTPVTVETMSPGTCMARPDPAYHGNSSIIVMEEEWRKVDVSYPQYVYTLSGWIQVLNVESYTPKPALRVIIVPHSHQDVGWTETADKCYTSNAKLTLNNAVHKLAEHGNWRFIWSEMAFLARWFKEASSDQKLAFKKAVAGGQMEVVTGGWVMTEEACAHFAPMLDQLTEGHLWLKEELGVEPNSSWSVDPFGHSPTMAYLLQASGISNMVIQRVHFGIKRHLASAQRLEFDWRQSWDESGSTDISCHLMPFLSYAIMYSCGPDPHVCCQFDFFKSKCLRGKKFVTAAPVTNDNVKKLSWSLWEQFQKKAQLYSSNVILVPHGDDFRYTSVTEWDHQFGNLEKLIDYMNADRDMNIRVQFGTVTDYFRAVAEDRKKAGGGKVAALPKFVGDLFPYNDRDDQYWTGFYSSRPLYKYMGRVLQAKLRSTEILYTVVVGQLMSQKKDSLVQAVQSRYTALQEARRSQATFMHHDAVTGTAKASVVRDYADILTKAMTEVDGLFSLLLSVALTSSARSAPLFKMNEDWPSAKGPPVLREAELTVRTVVVTNPLTSDWLYVVKVRVLDPNIRVTSDDGSPVRQQINPVWDSGRSLSENVLEIVFEAEVSALSMRTYGLEVQQASTQGYATVTLHSMDLQAFTQRSRLPFKVSQSSEEMFQIQSHTLTATFSACTGTLQHIMRKSDDLSHKVGIKFMTYSTGSWSNPFKDKSGAYIFMPDGPAKTLDAKYPEVIVVEGELSSTVYTFLPNVTHVTSLYNVTGPVGAGVHVENVVSLGSSQWNNKELVMRLVTDVVHPDNAVCVDLNGFQMTRKAWRGKQLIQGNFHPLNTMAFLEDTRTSRLSLLSAQPHGLASLNFGWMEVVLDRRLMQDDWRGMGEGVTDNAPTPSKFLILLEKRDTPARRTPPHQPSSLCRPSLLAELLSRHLSHPPVVSLSHLDATSLAEGGRYALLDGPLPCPLHLVNLRARPPLSVGERMSALMVLHHPGVDCSFSELHRACDLASKLPLKIFKGTRLWKVSETRLTGLQESAPLDLSKQVDVPSMELKTLKLDFF